MASEPELGPLGLLGNHEIAASSAAVLVAMFAFIRWLLGLAGARQDKRIALLEARVAQADNRAMAIAQVVMALIPVVEANHPDHPALHDARAVLKKAFPADAPDHPET